MWLGLGKQAVKNTAVAPTKYFEVTEISGILEEYETKKSDRRVGSRFKPLGRKTNKKVPLSFSVEANPENVGLILKLALGAEVVAAAGAAYQHTFSLAEELPYFTAVASSADVASSAAGETVHQIINCKVVSIKIDATTDDVIKIAIEAIGTARSAVAAATFTPDFPDADPFFAKAEEGQAKLEIGAAVASLAEFDEANEFHLSISNGVATDMRIDNTDSAFALREGDSEITGNMKAMYNRNTLTEIEAFQAGTQRAIRFTATSEEEAASGYYFTLIFTADKAKYSGAPASWDPDVISADAAFEVEKTTSYPIISLVNADAAEY